VPIRTITTELVQNLIDQAARSPRLRANYNFHEAQDTVQRMINALVPGTYVTPHKHENPDKVEMLSILTGRAAFFHYDAAGTVLEMVIMDAEGPIRAVDIPPRAYHNFVALTPCAVLEIIQGPYDPATHKQFAPWAPAEGSPECAAYLAKLEQMASAS
jgi:cupin fold WbuC family metalloprotein